jgi:hypothetical protein
MSSRPVTASDIEAKLRALQASLSAPVERAQPSLVAIASTVGVALLAVAYLVGRRKGRLSSTVVEIRRI